jgi:hypothetical protein
MTSGRKIGFALIAQRRSLIVMAVVFAVTVNCVFVVSASGAAGSLAGWSIASSPNTGSAGYDYLEGVSCPSTSDCIAVGYYYRNSNVQTLIEQWNGSTWSIMPSADTDPNRDNYLNGVSCSSSSACTAVGYSSKGNVDQTLAERLIGTVWSIVSSANRSPQLNEYLSGISCPSPSQCTAVGASYNGVAYETLIEQLHQGRWSIDPSGNTSESDGNYLSGVSCPMKQACTAVGHYFANGSFKTLVEKESRNRWSITKTPNKKGSHNDDLDGVSCAEASTCTAVGDYDGGMTQRTLIERSVGGIWAIVPSPNATTSGANFLDGVSCTKRSCTAVGHSFTGAASLTLIERWTGAEWSIVPSPNVSAKKTNSMNGVSCSSPTTCIAVGYFDLVTDNTLVMMSGIRSRVDR